MSDYDTSKQEQKIEINTSESDNTFTINLVDSDIGLLDFYIFKAYNETEYVYVFNMSNTTVNPNINHTYVLEFNSANEVMYSRNLTKYKSHFVTKNNWVDADLNSQYTGLTSYVVTKIDDYTYRTTITTPETTLIFEGIGGVNKGGSLSIIEIDTGIPEFNALNIFTDSLLANDSYIPSSILNFTFNVSDKNNDSVVFYVDGVRNVSSTYQSNITKNQSITFTQDGNYTVLIEINDSATNKLNSSTYSFVVDTTSPTGSSIFNRTITDNTTNIKLNTSVNLTFFIGDIYLEFINISHNASGTFVNETLTNAGNGTYYKVLGHGNFTSGRVVGWQIWAFDKAGNNFGLSPPPTHTFEPQGFSLEPPPSAVGGGGGGTGKDTDYQQKCNDLGKTYQQCLTYNSASFLCEVGCEQGYICSANYVCQAPIISAVTSTASLFSDFGKNTLNMFSNIGSWFTGLFTPQRQMAIEPQQTVIAENETAEHANIVHALEGQQEQQANAQTQIKDTIAQNNNMVWAIAISLVALIILWYYGILPQLIAMGYMGWFIILVLLAVWYFALIKFI